MGGAGLPWLVIVVVVGVLAVAGLLVFAPWVRARQERADALAERRHDRDVVTYEVPPGQDPVAVLTALGEAGLHAEPEAGSAHQRLLIDAPTVEAREQAREAIAEAPLNTQGDPAPDQPVVFTDE